MMEHGVRSGISGLSRWFVLFAAVFAVGGACLGADEISFSRPIAWMEAEKSQLDDRGLDLFCNYSAVFLANPVGGESQYAAYTQFLTIGGALDLEKTVGWRGASLTISVADIAGHNLSEEIGNFFTVANQYVTNTFLLYDLYLDQKLFDDRLEIRVGRFAAGDVFAALPAFLLQVNAGINSNPFNLTVNVPFTTAPDTTWAACLRAAPTSVTYVSTGIFQATPRTGIPAYHGFDFSIREGDGVLLIAELGWTPAFGAKDGSSGKDVEPASPGLPGTHAIGAYYSNYTFDEFLGGTQHNACGFYAMAQQMVWRSVRDEDTNVSLWGAVAWSPQVAIAIMPFYAATGTILQGFVPGRDQDQFLFNWQIGGFSGAYADSVVDAGGSRPTYESIFECSYLVQVSDAVTVQPDVQYVVRPSGLGTIANALVLGMQCTVNF